MANGPSCCPTSIGDLRRSLPSYDTNRRGGRQGGEGRRWTICGRRGGSPTWRRPSRRPATIPVSSAAAWPTTTTAPTSSPCARRAASWCSIAFPYNNGHLLVAPRAHKGRLDELDADELLETMETLRRMVRVLDELMRPDGYNVGLNLGRAAGAGLPGHLHWHIVPRWNGDTNFMPVLADVKVIVQSLDALYDLLTGSDCASQGSRAAA